MKKRLQTLYSEPVGAIVSQLCPRRVSCARQTTKHTQKQLLLLGKPKAKGPGWSSASVLTWT